MQRVPKLKTYAGLASGVLILGCLLALALPLVGREPAKAPAPAASAPASPVAAAPDKGVDLDGDSRPDKVAITGSGMTVTSAAGATLLEFSAKVLPGYTALPLGGQFPVLFVRTAESEYAAFSYDPSRGIMQTIAWPDGSIRGRGELTETGDLLQPVLMGPVVRRRATRLALDRLQLKAVSAAFQPLKEPRKLPADALSAAVEAAMLGLKDEMAVHFPDPDVARDFYAQWHGKLPASGVALVANADDVNQGAEHGHMVPVTVWISNEEKVAAIKGEAEFVSAPAGVQILKINVKQEGLRVTSWTDAARRVKQKRPMAGQLQRTTEVPFYGRFRFSSPGGRFAVDAYTGNVEEE